MIQAGRRNKIAFDGKEELERRFGNGIISATWEWHDDAYWVNVFVQPSDGGDVMCFTEYLEEFPSDECITTIALVT